MYLPYLVTVEFLLFIKPRLKTDAKKSSIRIKILSDASDHGLSCPFEGLEAAVIGLTVTKVCL